MAGMTEGDQLLAWTSTYEHTHPDDMEPDILAKLAKAMKLIQKIESETTVMGKPWREWPVSGEVA
jgi:hypothetical protein